MRVIRVVVLVCLAAAYTVTAQDFSTGLVFTDDAAYYSIPQASAPLRGELPPSADLSEFCPKPGDQGQQGSCTAWSVAYGMKSFQEQQERKWGLATTDHLFSPAFIFNQIKLDTAGRGGSTYTDALELISREGVATLAAFPYSESDCSRLPDNAIKNGAKQFAIANWRRVNIQDPTEIKSMIASNSPVMIGMLVDRKFQALRGSDVYTDPQSDKLGGHAMLIVGYDDAKGAFKLLNSWGQSWGDRGYGWILYQTLRKVAREAYVAQDIVSVTPPSPNPVTPTPSPSPAPPGPPSPPPPAPVPTIPTAELGAPTVVHNFNFGGRLGMSIAVPGKVSNAVGQTAQIVVRFALPNGTPMGTPLWAHPQELRFRDAQGLVATGTELFPVSSNPFFVNNYQMIIPYYALNLGKGQWQVTATATLYLNNFPIATSPPALLTVIF